MADLEPQEALVHLMVAMAAADGAVRETELRELSLLLQTLPVFSDFDLSALDDMVRHCSAILDREDGIDEIIGNVTAAVPANLYETAYALAVEVAASDVNANQPELRFLEMLRDAFELDRLTSGAIEHSARVRYRRL
ncbi:tellurite resistance TerB family protein [Aurantimonas sp. VKM B-3413]|uniref:tellurite resistance TerB family protein n=1 Tax=Aurantimonas sp. VKM B-3413 TaxID=2779401 RepID=UPI001E29E85A|nr:tellurite resistance TerB family protein [Aurantimonas sp. VKM B-3413]MCB8840126.1 tellurite resistance TerB family protein [Aurantimonas sp. VKM B-3413]